MNSLQQPSAKSKNIQKRLLLEKRSKISWLEAGAASRAWIGAVWCSNWTAFAAPHGRPSWKIQKWSFKRLKRLERWWKQSMFLISFPDPCVEWLAIVVGCLRRVYITIITRASAVAMRNTQDSHYWSSVRTIWANNLNFFAVKSSSGHRFVSHHWNQESRLFALIAVRLPIRSHRLVSKQNSLSAADKKRFGYWSTLNASQQLHKTIIRSLFMQMTWVMPARVDKK